MTTNQASARSETVRKRRTQPVPQNSPQKIKRDYRPAAVKSPVKPISRTSGRSTQSRSQSYNTNRRHFDIAINTPRANIRTPGITLPALGPRLASAILIVVMGFTLLTMWNSPMFQVSGARVSGNLRLTEADINSSLKTIGKPIFSTLPEAIKEDLLLLYPEIETINVKISFPNQIIVHLTERVPILVWQRQDGTADWVDAQGFKFPIRGQVENLVTITASGDPPILQVEATESVDPANSIMPVATAEFIQPLMIKAITELIELAPQGAAISYDPSYGLGWSDPRNWKVYFGENTENISAKLMIYQAIIDKLTLEGIQPSMISVEYLDAPFYRTQ
jgi:cell division protein FtsQ